MKSASSVALGADRFGLVLPEDLSYEQWAAVARQTVEANKSAAWALGDVLAYGHAHYAKSHWGDRVPTELYERLALETGYAVHTLHNARCVCAALPRSRRRDGLTFSQAVEIVHRAEAADVDRWIERAVTDGLTVKTLREKLRQGSAVEHSDDNDVGATSFLETARQFARDYCSTRTDISPIMRAELRKILKPVLADLG